MFYYLLLTILFCFLTASGVNAQIASEKDLDADGFPGVQNISKLRVPPQVVHSTGDLLAISWTPTNSPVYQIDSVTGSGFQIGLSGIGRLNSMARDGSGVIYSVGGESITEEDKLVIIDPVSGAATQIATIDLGKGIPSIRGLAWSPQEELFGIQSGFTVSNPEDSLYSIDVTTGLGTFVGYTGFTGIQGLAFSPSGELFAWDTGEGLLLIDKTTGVATDVNPLVGGDCEIQTIDFLPDGTLLGARHALFSIDLATGECTGLGSGGYTDVRGMIVLEPNDPVPVELTSFTISVVEKRVILEWQTQTETNNFGFDIERMEASNWATIAFVKGQGTTTQPRHYKYLDPLPDDLLNITTRSYRLKQIDTDGSFEYSHVIEVNLALPKTAQLLQNYPNPFNPQTTIAFILPESAPVEIAIFNTRAERVRLLLSSFKEAGSHLVFWSGKNDSGRAVASGIYFYTLSAHGETLFTRQMTLVR